MYRLCFLLDCLIIKLVRVKVISFFIWKFISSASLFHKKHIVSIMKGSSDSTSSSKLTWVLVQAKKLYWNADGTTNLPKLKADVIQASSKGAYGIYSVCLVTSKISKEWIDEFLMITEREWVLMIDPEEKSYMT